MRGLALIAFLLLIFVPANLLNSLSQLHQAHLEHRTIFRGRDQILIVWSDYESGDPCLVHGPRGPFREAHLELVRIRDLGPDHLGFLQRPQVHYDASGVGAEEDTSMGLVQAHASIRPILMSTAFKGLPFGFLCENRHAVLFAYSHEYVLRLVIQDLCIRVLASMMGAIFHGPFGFVLLSLVSKSPNVDHASLTGGNESHVIF